MTRSRPGILALVLALMVTSAGYAQSTAAEERRSVTEHPRVALSELITAADRSTDRQFLVDARVSPEVVAGPSLPRRLSYGAFLSILRNNGMAAVTVGDVTNVIPVAEVRQFPLPLLYEDDASLHAEEWVTRLVTVRNVRPERLIPILRPLLPQAGHLAANPDASSLVIVDRAGNARRISELIRKLDGLAPPDED